MRIRYLAFALLVGILSAENLPDAPSLKARTHGFVMVAPGDPNVVHNSPSTLKSETTRTLNWQFLTANGIYAAATTFDLLETSRGVSNGCEEASQALGPHPSTGRIVGYGIAEFAGITAVDYGLKRWARHIGTPTWMQGALGTLGASIGTFKHVHGGYKWTQTGCL
jgi:hypothetical protein